MTKVKVSEATGPVLDWMVAVVEDESVRVADGLVRFALSQFTNDYDLYAPSDDWAQGGPIIEREGVNLSIDYQDDALSDDMIPIGWKANLWNNSAPGSPGFLQWSYGPTPLVACMRCYVTSKLGDEVEVPEELLK